MYILWHNMKKKNSSHSDDKAGTGEETDVELRRDVSPVSFLLKVIVIILFQMLRLDTVP